MKLRRCFLVLAVALLADVSRAQSSMRLKLDRILVPELEYRQTAVREVLEDLREKSVQLDREGEGINLVMLLDEKTGNRPITLHLHNVTLGRALRLVCSSSLIEVRVEPSAIILKPARPLGKPGGKRPAHLPAPR